MNSRGLMAGILLSVWGTFTLLPGTIYGGCTCDAWCRGRGYPDGICGDGHTCICTGMDPRGCTCDAWCRGRGYSGGVCGDGHTCMCNGMNSGGCTCDAWCRGRGYHGGICGDGHTCMCDRKRAKQIDRNPCRNSRARCKNDVTNISTQDTYKLTK